MTRVRELTVLARDPDLVRRGILPWTSIDVTLRWLHVSSATITLPATSRILAQTQPGWGVIVLLDGEQILSGSIEDADQERTAVDDSQGSITITVADDLGIVAGEIAYPNPSAAANSQDSDSHDVRSGPAETVIKGYVAANVGTGRAAARRDAAAPLVREVVVATDLGRGDAVSYRARFPELMEIIRQVHGGLGVQVVQVGQALVFDVVEPVDRTTSATFSFAMGNLVRCRWNRGFAEVTHVVVAGQGEAENRTFRERRDSAHANEWRMIRRIFKDQRNTDDTSELDQAGDEELEKARRTAVLEAELVDTARLTYGDGYRLGDRVTISPQPGVLFSDQITEVRIRADTDPGDVTITPAIGWDGGPYETRQDRQVRDATRRISQLERSL